MGLMSPFKLFGATMTVKMWLIVGAAVLAVALALFTAGTGFGYTWAQGNAAEEAKKLADEVAEDKRQQLLALNAANDLNRTLEQEHEKRVATIRAEFAAKEAAAKAADDRTIADLKSGNKRLRLSVNSCGTTPASNPDGSPGGVHDTSTAELTGETSAALWGIAADGDSAIRKLNGLQDWAESAVKLCKPPTGLPEGVTK